MLVRQVLRAYVSVRASRTLHSNMLDSLLKTKMSFFGMRFLNCFLNYPDSYHSIK